MKKYYQHIIHQLKSPTFYFIQFFFGWGFSAFGNLPWITGIVISIALLPICAYYSLRNEMQKKEEEENINYAEGFLEQAQSDKWKVDKYGKHLSLRSSMYRCMQSALHPADYAKVLEDKYMFCDFCDHIVSGGVSWKDKDGMRWWQCSVCSHDEEVKEKENGIEYKWEKSAEQDNVMEYNQYVKGTKIAGGLRILCMPKEESNELSS